MQLWKFHGKMKILAQVLQVDGKTETNRGVQKYAEKLYNLYSEHKKYSPITYLNWHIYIAKLHLKWQQVTQELRFFQTVWWTIWLPKIFQAVLCPTQLFQWKLICTFNQHCLSYKISNILPIQILFLNSSKLCCIDITFPRCATHSKDV